MPGWPPLHLMLLTHRVNHALVSLPAMEACTTQLLQSLTEVTSLLRFQGTTDFWGPLHQVPGLLAVYDAVTSRNGFL